MTSAPTSRTIIQRFTEEYQSLRRNVVYASYEDVTDKLDWLSIVGDGVTTNNQQPIPGQNVNPRSAPSPNLLGDHFLFLRSVADHQHDGLTRHYDRCNFGREKGNRILRELKAAGCVAVTKAEWQHPKGGRVPLIASTTAKGLELLKSFQTREQTRQVQEVLWP